MIMMTTTVITFTLIFVVLVVGDGYEPLLWRLFNVWFTWDTMKNNNNKRLLFKIKFKFICIGILHN